MNRNVGALVTPLEVLVGQSRVDIYLIRRLARDGVCLHGDTSSQLLRGCQRARPLVGRYRIHCRSLKSFGLESGPSLQRAYNRAEKEGLQHCSPEMLVRILERKGVVIRPDRSCLFAMKPGSSDLIFQFQGIQKPLGVERLVRILPQGSMLGYTQNTELIFCEQM